MSYEPTLITAVLAAHEWLFRLHGFHRPKGEVTWDKINCGRMHFVANPDEIRKCCKKVEDTKLYYHCRSTRHVAALYGVTQKQLYKAVKDIRNEH